MERSLKQHHERDLWSACQQSVAEAPPADPFATSYTRAPLIYSETDKHEPFLSYFDGNGIKVFLRIEPGFADVEKCIDLVLTQYKKHQCVVGWGIDVEWFRNAKTGTDNAVATDDLVKARDARVKSYSPKYRIFVKHFRTADLPRTYRGDVVSVNDSQQFDGLDSFLKEYKEFTARTTPPESFFNSLV